MFFALRLAVPFSMNPALVIGSYAIKYGLLAAGLAFAGLGALSAYRQGRARKALMGLWVLSVTAVIALGGLELLFASLDRPAPASCVVGDDVLGHGQKPGATCLFPSSEWNVTVRVNSLGLRGGELPAQKPALRVLMLGDSFTQGYGVEENQTFSSLLEARLRTDGLDAEVINAGVVSYSPIVEYLYLKTRGLALKPDVVVLNFDMSDVQDDFYYERAATFGPGGLPVAIASGTTAQDSGGALGSIRNLRVVGLFRSLIERLYLSFEPADEPSLAGMYDVEYDRYAITRQGGEKLAADWARSLKYIKLAAGLSREHNVTFVLATYPYGHQVSPTEWGEGRHTFNFVAGKAYGDGPEKVLSSFAGQEGIPFVGMFPAFANASGGPFYYGHDGHFNAAGHAVAAQALYSGLTSEGIIKAPSAK